MTMRIAPLRRALHASFGSTGMNGDASSAQDCLRGYLRYVEVHGRDVLELGPGHTPDVLLAAREAGAARCVGIDTELVVDPRLTKYSAIELIQYDGRLIPFATESFDVVWSSDVLEHVRAPKAVVREAFRVLRPGGWFLAAIDLRDHYFLGVEERWLNCLRYPEGLWRAMASNRSSYVNRLRASDWAHEFRSSGFSVHHTHEVRSPVLESLHARGAVPCARGALTYSDAAVYRIDVALRKPEVLA